MTTYIADTAHYNDVLSRVARIEHTLWIGTADIKDLYVKVGTSREPSDRTPEYYRKRPCAEYVACAARIVGEYLMERGCEL